MAAPAAALADPSAALKTPAAPDIASRVRAQLRRDYPPNALAWVAALSWAGPARVPLSQVDRASGKAEWAAAAADKAKLQSMRKKIAAGHRKPVILVRPAGGGKLFAVDGHSRITASEADGWVSAYVGTAAAAHGPWESAHSRQLAGDGPAVELSAQTPALAVTPHPFGSPSGPGLFRVKGLSLPSYIQNIAHALLRTGRAEDESSAIQLAIGAVQRWARGQGKVSPGVRAAAAAALGQWEAAKATAHAHAGEPGGIELAWDAGAHPRVPPGTPAGGQFGSAASTASAKPAPGAGMSHGRRAARAAQLRAQAATYRDRAAQVRREITAGVAALRAAVKTQKAARAAAAKTAAASASGTKAATATTAKASTAAKAVTTSAAGVTIAARARSIASMRSHVVTLRAQARALDAEAAKLDAQAKAL
jgi:hypothetical protein